MATTLLQFDAAAMDGDIVPVTTDDKAAYQEMEQGRMVLCFPDGDAEYAAVTRSVRMPQAYASGTITAKIGYYSTQASNAVQWEVYVEAVTDADATDLDAGTSFDSANTTTDTCEATAGYLGVASVTLTNKDSVAVGDNVRFLLRRDSDHASDSNTGTAKVLWLAIEE